MGQVIRAPRFNESTSEGCVHHINFHHINATTFFTTSLPHRERNSYTFAAIPSQTQLSFSENSHLIDEYEVPPFYRAKGSFVLHFVHLLNFQSISCL